MIRFAPNWRELFRRAWSVRLIAAFTLLEIVGIWLSVRGVFSEQERLSLWFQIAGALLGVSAFVARLIWQRGLSKGDEK